MSVWLKFGGGGIFDSLFLPLFGGVVLRVCVVRARQMFVARCALYLYAACLGM
jgi:hypothetical protein